MTHRVFSFLWRAASLLIVISPSAVSNSFLGEDHGGFDASRHSQDLRRAMDEVLGCGAEVVEAERIEMIERAISPMWQTLPKNVQNRVDWKTLRYTAHRYFMQQSSLVVRGFEPSLFVNGSHSGAAHILSEQVPAHVDLLLGQGHSRAGFSLEDAAIFIAALEQLIFNSEAELLEEAYYEQTILTHGRKTLQELQEILEVYLVLWMAGDDMEVRTAILKDRSLLEETIPNWASIQAFINGRVRTLAFARAQSPRAGQGQSLMQGTYSFGDAHEVVGGITRTFQSFWQSECVAMKEQLITRDKDFTGRVNLGDFYGDGADENWHFGESYAYLRDLGALDETSGKGPQVIIPNYLQAASNCIVSGAHYLVCCTNECEGILAEIEANISAPLATPEEIMAVVAPLRAESPESMGRRPNKRQKALVKQLEHVASVHGGKVPLHGRLFAQWLHYSFPRECPFPHKAGDYAGHTLTTSVYGMENAITTSQEMQAHGFYAQKLAIMTAQEKPEAEVWRNTSLMTQWSEDEELFADYATMATPWERQHDGFHSALLAVAAAALAVAACVTGGEPKDGVPKIHRV